MPAEWYSGMQIRGSSSGARSRSITQDTYSLTSAAWVIIAPLGFDVVPEV